MNRYTNDQIEDLCALIEEVADVASYQVSRASVATIFADAALSAIEDPEGVHPDFLRFSETVARIANRVPA